MNDVEHELKLVPNQLRLLNVYNEIVQNKAEKHNKVFCMRTWGRKFRTWAINVMLGLIKPSFCTCTRCCCGGKNVALQHAVNTSREAEATSLTARHLPEVLRWEDDDDVAECGWQVPQAGLLDVRQRRRLIRHESVQHLEDVHQVVVKELFATLVVQAASTPHRSLLHAPLS